MPNSLKEKQKIKQAKKLLFNEGIILEERRINNLSSTGSMSEEKDSADRSFEANDSSEKEKTVEEKRKKLFNSNVLCF